MPNLFVSATDARNNFFDLLERVKKGPYPINVTINGIPEAVIISRSDYEGWMATLETLSDPELMESIKQSEKDLKAKRYSTLDEVEKELNLNDYVIADRSKKRYVSGKFIKFGKKRSKKTR